MNGASATPLVTTILVGLDGSPESDAAALFAAGLARQVSARVVAGHSVGLLDVWPEHLEQPKGDDRHARVRALLEGPWTEALRAAGVQPTTVLHDGPPAHALLAIAEEVDADLIVVGSRGIGKADPFALGSTSTRVAQTASRPVVIVPGGRT